MVIDPKIEDPIRTMLGQAVRGELRELDKMIDTIGDEVYGTGIEYCILATAYIAIDLSERWPTDADVREMARHIASSSTDYALRQQDVHDYIARSALAGEPITDVFPAKDVDVKLPILITAKMLLAFRAPRDMDLWEYLDTIWNALNTAGSADMSMLPALLIRQKRSQVAAKR
jgi:hypothetical protein